MNHSTASRRAAVLAAVLLSATFAASAAHAGSGTSSDGLVSWSTGAAPLAPPGNAVMPTYFNGLDDTGNYSAITYRYGADDNFATAHTGEAATGFTDLLQTYQGNSRMKSSQMFTPGSPTQSAQNGFYLQGPGTWYFHPDNPGLDSAGTNLYFSYYAGISYFSALVNFTGLDTAAINVYDAKNYLVASIDPTTQYYQTNTDSSGNLVYSMFVTLTSATSDITSVSFYQSATRFHNGGPSTMYVSQVTESPTAGGLASSAGEGSSDVPEPGLLALGGLVALGGIGSVRRRRRSGPIAA